MALKIRLIFRAILIVILLVIIATLIIFSLNAKTIIETQIRSNLKIETKIDKIEFRAPLGANIYGITLGEFAKIEKISLSVNPLGFLAGKLVFDEVIIKKPSLDIVLNKDGSLNLPVIANKAGKQPAILLIKLIIEEGRVKFIDKKICADGLEVDAEHLNAYIAKVMSPITSLKVDFNITANLTTEAAKTLGDIFVAGWIDFKPKDMKGNLFAKGIGIEYFAPYYGNFISHKKLQSGKLNFSSEFMAQQNDLTAQCSVLLTDLVYAQAQADETPATIDLTSRALDLFANPNGDIKFDFNLKTKLDRPYISQSDFKQIVIQAAAKNLMSQSPEDLANKINSTISDFKAFGKEMEKIFKKDKDDGDIAP